MKYRETSKDLSKYQKDDLLEAAMSWLDTIVPVFLKFFSNFLLMFFFSKVNVFRIKKKQFNYKK